MTQVNWQEYGWSAPENAARCPAEAALVAARRAQFEAATSLLRLLSEDFSGKPYSAATAALETATNAVFHLSNQVCAAIVTS
jgi:hypothetical protein